MLAVEELKQNLRLFLNDAESVSAGGRTVSWVDALTLRLEQDKLVIGFPHGYFELWFRKHKQAAFEKALERILPIIQTISYEDSKACGIQENELFPPAPAQAFQEGQAVEQEDFVATSATQDLAEDAFAGFIVNAKNDFPLATAKKIASEQIPETGAIAVFCGKSGTGKTRVLEAMKATLECRLGCQRIFMTQAAKFCEDIFTANICHKNFWQECDALILDDLQDITDKSQLQNSLALLMDACPNHQPENSLATEKKRTSDSIRPRSSHFQPNGRLLVFAHAGPSQELAKLEERLRSRLLRGLVLELLEPDLDVRLRYLQRAANERKLALPREQLLYLAQRCPQFSLIQGLLHKIEIFAALHGQLPLQADLEKIVRTGGSLNPFGCREILSSVARNFNLRIEDLLGARRRPDFVLARQVAMYICRRKLGLSYPELGRAFGGRDHSTVIHAVKKIHKLLNTDKVMHNLVTEMENAVS